VTRRGVGLALALTAVALLVAAAGPVAAADGDAAFDESVVAVDAGDTANVTVQVDAGANATVHVGSEAANFLATTTVVDADGDGRASLLLDTGAAGTDNASSYLSASSGDELRGAEQVTGRLDEPIEPGDYDLALGPRDDPVDVGTLSVQASGNSADRPPLPADSADSDAITVLPSESRVAVEPEPNRTIRGEADVAPGTNLSVRAVAESGRSYLQIDTVQVNDSGGFAATLDFDAATPGSTFTLTVSGPDDTRETVPGRVNGTWSADWDETGSTDGDSADGDADGDSADGDVDGGSEGTPSLPSDSADSDAITVLPAESNLTLEAGVGRVVNGETTLPPGTELTVRMRGVEGRAFLRSQTTDVSTFGTFDASFDLDDIPPGTTFALSVRGPNGTEETVPGRVVACEADCEQPEATPFPVEGFGVVAVAETTQGHTARIPIRLDDREAVTLVVGGDAVNYRTGITVRDDDGDGRVVVAFDTAAAGDDAPTLRVVSEGDSGEIAVEERDLSRLLDAAEYPLTLYAGETTDGDPIDTGRLVVHQSPRAAGTDATRSSPAPTATPTPSAASGGSPSGAGGGLLGSRLAGVVALAAGGLIALVGAALVLGRR